MENTYGTAAVPHLEREEWRERKTVKDESDVSTIMETGQWAAGKLWLEMQPGENFVFIYFRFI